MKNSDFQILSIMVGTRNTPDEAYRVLYFELEAQEHAYATAMSGRVRIEAALCRLDREECAAAIASDRVKLLEIEAERMQIAADRNRVESAVGRAEHEMAFIRSLMDQLEPLRKYGHLSQDQAFQACQAEEWALEYVKRAKRFLLTMGTIPQDHFEVMMAHPWWDGFILPHVDLLATLHAEGKLGVDCFTGDTPAFLRELQGAHPEVSQIEHAFIPPAPRLAFLSASAIESGGA